MIDCTEQFGINFANDNSLFPMSDGEILEQQKNDMEELEKQARMKEEQIKKEKLRIQNEKIEEEKKLKEIENKAKEAQKSQPIQKIILKAKAKLLAIFKLRENTFWSR